MDEEELEEKMEEMKEKRYLRSLSLLDLGRELGLAERAVERYREEGDEEKAEELEEYCEKVRRQINGGLDVSQSLHHKDDYEREFYFDGSGINSINGVIFTKRII